MARASIIGGGIVLLALAIIVYNFPFSESTMGGAEITVTIPVAVGICNSATGQLGQSFSSEAAKSCSEYNILINGIYGSGLLGIILIIVGVVVSGKKEDVSHLEERYAKGELSKGEFESKKEKVSTEQVETPIEILKERYAKGEITKEEFENMKKDLENS